MREMKLYMVMMGMKLPSFPTKGQPENVGQTHTGSLPFAKKTMFMNSFYLVLKSINARQLLIHGTILVYLPRSWAPTSYQWSYGARMNGRT